MTVKHPAKFSDVLMPIFGDIIERHRPDFPERVSLVLDPFAGTGRIHELRTEFVHTCGVEIEAEWAEMHEDTILGDATRLPQFWTNKFQFVVTSPTYANRMADNHNPGPTDKSRRITYRHSLGRPLTPGNTGQMQWGATYKAVHLQAWLEARRVLQPGGILVVNVRDHIRKGELIPVVEWHRLCILALGFDLIEHIEVVTPGMRFGANSELRVEGEHVLVFRLPNPKPNNLNPKAET